MVVAYILGGIKGDTRSVYYSSYGSFQLLFHSVCRITLNPKTQTLKRKPLASVDPGSSFSKYPY